MPPPARNTHHPQTSSRIRTTLSNRYRQNVTTKHGRQEHKQNITKSNHRDIAGISKSESQQPYNKGGLLTTTRRTHNSALTASSGARAWYSFYPRLGPISELISNPESTKPLKKKDFILTREMPTQSLPLFHLIK